MTTIRAGGVKWLGLKNPRDFGAVGDDVTDDSTAVASARTAAGADRPILLQNGDFNSNVTENFYGTDFRDALGVQFLLGTTATPATRHEPIVWIEKVTESDRDTIATAWDQGAFYGSLEKRDGDAFGAAVTGYGDYVGGTGDLVGVHGRAAAESASAASIFGGWFLADAKDGSNPTRAVAAEFNLHNNDGTALTWENNASSGSMSGIVVATTGTSPGTAHHGIRLSKNVGEGFLTGLQFGVGCIAPSDGNRDGEAIFINGGETTDDRFGGIRLGYTGQTHFHYGLRLNEAAFENNQAIWLAATHRIAWNDIAGDFSGITSPSAGTIQFFTEGAERARFSSTNGGAISVGTTITTRPANIGITATSDIVNTVMRLIQLSNASAVGAGRGVGFEFQVATQASNANLEIGALIEAVATDVTSTSEDFDLRFKVMAAGAAAAERMRLRSTGAPIFRPPSGAETLGTNGEVTFEFTNNTTLTFRARGSDGTSRTATLTLA